MSNAVESPGDRSFGYSEGTATWPPVILTRQDLSVCCPCKLRVV